MYTRNVNQGVLITNIQYTLYVVFKTVYMYMYIPVCTCTLYMYMYSRRQKNVSIFFRRTFKVRTVPFPYYGKKTVKKRLKNG